MPKQAKQAPATTTGKAAKANTAKTLPSLKAASKTVRKVIELPRHELTAAKDLRKRARALKLKIKRSGLVRAGLKALSSLSDEALTAALAGFQELSKPKGKNAPAKKAAKRGRSKASAPKKSAAKAAKKKR